MNPRRTFTLTRFRGVLLRPLGHATVAEKLYRTSPVLRPTRRDSGNDGSAAVAGEELQQRGCALISQHATATSSRWFSRRSRTTSHNDPTAPVLGSHARTPPAPPGLAQRARAHRARLDGDRERAPVRRQLSPSAARPRAAPAPRRARWGRQWPRGALRRRQQLAVRRRPPPRRSARRRSRPGARRAARIKARGDATEVGESVDEDGQEFVDRPRRTRRRSRTVGRSSATARPGTDRPRRR